MVQFQMTINKMDDSLRGSRMLLLAYFEHVKLRSNAQKIFMKEKKKSK